MLQKQERTQAASEQPPEPVMASREEGELSDGELEEHSAADNFQTTSREHATTAQMSRNSTYTTAKAKGPSGTSVHAST